MAENTTEENAETEDATVASEEVTAAEETSTEETSTEEAPAAEQSDAAAELTLGSGAPAEEAAEPLVEPTIRGKIDKFGTAMGTGRRKTSVARVRITKGDGDLTINGRPLNEYFKTDRDRQAILAPLQATEMEGKVNVWVRVGGGGTTGQSGAVVLGIARALEALDNVLHYKLAEEGYLTRDSRMVERKKYGFKKARRSFQFSKR